MTIKPPIVGVPALILCDAGVCGFTDSIALCFSSNLMNFGPKISEKNEAVMNAAIALKVIYWKTLNIDNPKISFSKSGLNR